MSVSNGQRANAQTFNDAFLSRTTDSDTVAIIGLNHPSSGGLIANAQQKINDNTSAIVSNDADIANLFAQKQDLSEKGIANGYAELDGSGKVPLSQIPDKFASIEGNWNASTNTPTLADGVGNLGEIYVVDVAGTQDLGSGSQTFDVGDWVLYNSANEWIKVINSTAVTSVNGLTGAVSLALDNLTDVDLTTTPPLAGQALVYDGADWVPGDAGSGSGVGGISYVLNPDAEIDASDHSVYNDGAVSEPVDGTGGAPNITVVRTTTAAEILRGAASFKIEKPGGTDCQGDGVHIGLDPIDPRDVFQRLQVSFDYKMIAPLNTLDGDFRVFVYDVDNAALIGAIENDDNGDLLNHEGDGATFIGWFNATDSLNYRLLVHCTTTDVSQRRVVYDNVKLGPIDGFIPVINYGDAEDRLSYANASLIPTGLGTGTGTYYYYLSRREGDSLRLRFGFLKDASAGTGTSAVEFPIPDGLTIKPTTGTQNKFTLNALTFGVDHNITQDSGADQYMAVGVFYDTVNNTIKFNRMGTGSTLQGQFIGANAQIFVDILIPIDGWTSGNVVSNTELTQKTTIAKIVRSASLSTGASELKVTGFSSEIDSHSIFDSVNDKLIANRDGLFRLTANAVMETFDGQVTLAYKINGGTSVTLTRGSGVAGESIPDGREGIDILDLSKGDEIEFYIFAGTLVRDVSEFRIILESIPDFNNYGVLNPNLEIYEVEKTTTATIGSPTTDTWYLPDAAYRLTLPEGTYDIKGLQYIGLVCSGGQALAKIALATSATPGVGIIKEFLSSLASDGGGVSRKPVCPVMLPNYTVGPGGTDIYVHLMALQLNSATVTSLQFGAFFNAESILSAIKLR